MRLGPQPGGSISRDKKAGTLISQQAFWGFAYFDALRGVLVN